MNQILLTVSGAIPSDIEASIRKGERPLADYVAMAHGFPADLMDYSAARQAGGRIGWLLEKTGGPNLMLAWTCFLQRRRYRVLFTDGEQVGLVLALLLKFANRGPRPLHVMIAHRLSARKKMALLDLLGLHTHVDTFFTYATRQRNFIRARWKLPPERVAFTPFMVDARFFSPEEVPPGHRLPDLDSQAVPLICSAGLEFRDYPTFMEAVRGLPVQAVLAAASPWSKRSDTTAHGEIPENVLVRRFTQYELRDLYAASRFVVMPLYPVDFQAGVTAILEAMAMGKAVICTCTPGQTDVVVAGETGLYVEAGDALSLRAAIQRLLDHPEEAERMGRNGRRRVEENMSLDRYVARLSWRIRCDLKLQGYPEL